MLERSTGQRNDAGGASVNMRLSAGVTILIVAACTSPRESVAGADSSAPATGRAADSASRIDSTLWVLAPDGVSADIDRGAARAALVQRFGAANVIDTVIYLGEGETRSGTVLFPRDSSRRLEIVWADARAQSRLARVQFSGSRSVWTIAPGIGLGTTLKEIERMNGGPFTVMGFGWDYGGNIVSFRGGKLDHFRRVLPEVFIGLTPTDYSPKTQSDRDAIMGEKEFSSGADAFQRLNPVVEQVVVIHEAVN